MQREIEDPVRNPLMSNSQKESRFIIEAEAYLYLKERDICHLPLCPLESISEGRDNYTKHDSICSNLSLLQLLIVDSMFH